MNQELFRSSVQALFEGRATPLQKTLIGESMSDPAYRELYFLLLEEWESRNPQLIMDPDEAFGRWQRQVASGAGISEKTTTGRPLHHRFSLAVAASVLILCGIGGFLFRDTLLNRSFSTRYGELKTVYLSDGSRVTLNANSSVTLPRFGFGKSGRKVFLDGEAEFSVTHLPGHQSFIVRTASDLEIKVLGTEFVVYSRPKGSKVALSKGKVQLTTGKRQDAEPMIMKPGDVVTVSGEGELTWKHDQSPAMHTGWKYHRFTFDNTSLSAIAGQLQDVFGVNIIIPDSSLAKRTIGGTYEADSAEKVLHILADVLEIRVVSTPASAQLPPTYTLTY